MLFQHLKGMPEIITGEAFLLLQSIGCSWKKRMTNFMLNISQKRKYLFFFNAFLGSDNWYVEPCM